MRFESVQTLREAMQLRVLRNSCRAYLTNRQEHIGMYQQCRWYFRTYRTAQKRGTYRAYLLVNESGNAVGYGALSLEEQTLLVTECVAPKFRHRGYGRLILQHLIEIAASEKRILLAEIWANNESSIALHQRAGFEVDSTTIKNDQELRRYSFHPKAISQNSEWRRIVA